MPYILNLDFLVICYFVGLFVDWVFQWDWQAVNKSKWAPDVVSRKSFWALFTHSLIYATMTSLIVGLLLHFSVMTIFIMFVILYTTHMGIDSRIPVKKIMKFKGMTQAQIDDVQTYGFMHIGIDHRLHEAVIVAMAFFIR